MSDLTTLTGELATMKQKMVDRLVAQGDETVQNNDTMETIVQHFESLRKIKNQTLNVTENGSYRAPAGFTGLNDIVVNVPAGGPTTHKLFSVLERVIDDNENPVGTVIGFHYDADGKEYAVIALDAKYRLASGAYLDANINVPDLPAYNDAGAYGAKETATFNCDKILAVDGHASSAVSHCRAKKFTIDGTEYAGQLPTLMELLKIYEFMAEVNANDPSATEFADLVLKKNVAAWSSTKVNNYGSAWSMRTNGTTNNISETSQFFVAPVIEIPNTIA